MTEASPLVATVRRFVAGLGPQPGGIVVAVSGGPDSVALLRSLLAIPDRPPLVIAHLNHLLRGAESDADEAFVGQLHATLQAATARLAVACARLDIAAQAHDAGDNLEAVARRVRYDWLAEVARDSGCRFIATGHTLDDQAETVLHRLLRGTGLQGLRGIAGIRNLESGVRNQESGVRSQEAASPLHIIRPLLNVSRQDVLNYLSEIGQAYRLDSSNSDPRFLRNRLRRELLPLLARDYNPAISRLLAQLAAQAEEAYAMIESQAGALLAQAELPRAGQLLIFDARVFRKASRHLVREALRLAWEREGWPRNRMGFDDWERLAAVVLGMATAVDLPNGIAARSRGWVVRIGPGL